MKAPLSRPVGRERGWGSGWGKYTAENQKNASQVTTHKLNPKIPRLLK